MFHSKVSPHVFMQLRRRWQKRSLPRWQFNPVLDSDSNLLCNRFDHVYCVFLLNQSLPNHHQKLRHDSWLWFRSLRTLGVKLNA